MRATQFEFTYRFWIIAASYAVGFSLSSIDPIHVATGLRPLIAPLSDPIRFTQLVIGTGTLLVFLAAALRTWAAAYLRSDVVHDTRQHSEALVADGPFRYLRNPLYLGSIVMSAGIGVLASRLGWLFIVVANCLIVLRLIGREEESLRRTQGDSYLAYCRAVPRLWPSLKPAIPSGNRPARWGQAFLGESFIWVFGLAELVLALTLNAQLGLATFVAGFVIHMISNRLIRR